LLFSSPVSKADSRHDYDDIPDKKKEFSPTGFVFNATINDISVIL
jgi:hypothetical protein